MRSLVGFDPDVFHNPSAEVCLVECSVVAVGSVVALVQATANDDDAVYSVSESVENQRWVDPAGAHDAHQSDLGSVLQPGDSS